MKASEARNAAMSNDEFKFICDEIKKSAEDGRFALYYPGELKKETIKKLKDNGFKVEFKRENFLNSLFGAYSYTYITWY